MIGSIRDRFSEADLEAIRDATREAESASAGEIVTVIVARSGSYESAYWKAMLFASALGFGGMLAFLRRFGGWLESESLWLAVGAIVGAALAAVAVRFSDTVRRLAAGEEALERQTLARARQAFIDEEVAHTRERTGVLLFLALFEHRVHLLADRGIAERVEEASWTELTERLAAGLAKGRPREALLEALRSCGELLERSGVERRADDRNEHADRPRLHDA